jgi:hypothetical protein
MPTNIIFSAIGEDHVKQAVLAAKSVKSSCADAFVTLHSNCIAESPWIDEQVEIAPATNLKSDIFNSKVAKLKVLRDCPHSEFIYLDSDVYVAANIAKVFQSDAAFDLACAHDTWRGWEKPQCLAPLNTGVLFVRRSKKTDSFLEKWIKEYERCENAPDQISFRELFYKHSEINKLVLPQEFNFRASEPNQLSGFVWIIHDYYLWREWNTHPAAVAHFVNLSQDNRAWIPFEGLHCLGCPPKFNRYKIALADHEAKMREITREFHKEECGVRAR